MLLEYYIRTFLKTVVKACGAILDGEIVVFEKLNNRFAVMGNNRTIVKNN